MKLLSYITIIGNNTFLVRYQLQIYGSLKMIIMGLIEDRFN